MAKGFSTIDDLAKFITRDSVTVIMTDGNQAKIPGSKLIAGILQHNIVAVMD